MKLIPLFFFIIMFMSFGFGAQYDYVFTVDFTRNGEMIDVNLVDVAILESIVPRIPYGETFMFTLYDGAKPLDTRGVKVDMTAQFILMNDSSGGGSTEIDELQLEIELPYNTNADRIEINSEWDSKTYMLGDYTCNNDGMCNFGENSQTCSNDCTKDHDGVCVHKIDYFCDPDCPKGKDVDCLREEQPTEPVCKKDNTCNPKCKKGADPDCTTPKDEEEPVVEPKDDEEIVEPVDDKKDTKDDEKGGIKFSTIIIILLWVLFLGAIFFFWEKIKNRQEGNE